MVDSIARKAFLTALAIVVPPVLVIQIYVASEAVRISTIACSAVFVLAAWLLGRSLSHRIRRVTAFADRILNPSGAHAPLPAGDDELGVLARSLTRIAPQVEELVNRLGMELARREAILASMTDAVLAVDARLTITFCNSAFVHAAGQHRAAEGLPLVRVVREPALREILTRVLESGEPARQRLRLANSEERSYDVSAVPMADRSSRGAIAILHDVTPGERLERMKRDLVANVSHEIRTPLATIRGYAETLLDGGLEDERNRRRFVEIIQANGVRLNNIAADLLTLSELESGRNQAQAGPILVGDALGGAMRAVEPAANLMGVRLTAGEIPDAYLLGHGIRLEQALLNLLDNAVKFNKPDGEVSALVEERGDSIEIRIRDTGVGIPAEDCSRIFERFYRVDKARSRQVGGTGLGLSIVKHAIEQMGGTVSVESQMGKGSTFIVTLPRYSGIERAALTA
ncbi:MAG: PAS domain-containing protein [Acidobacteriota bacterium]|nr:PAS domain-containing protein [Acidobacteriota bacterium]